jgi:beta-lactamase regulating signal transducer with metallopeptidase domain
MTMGTLLDLTVIGSVAAILVASLDHCVDGWMSARWRRGWWLLVVLAFLVPFRLKFLPALPALPRLSRGLLHLVPASSGSVLFLPAPDHRFPWITAAWLAGALSYTVLVAIQSLRAWRRWSRQRLSTDHALLELLEDCKAEAGITAPIGLVVASGISCPLILGWLRPRILLPAALASRPAADLRPILLHELAHFRFLDVPLHWLFAVARAIHWFNPLAHLSAIAWMRFREEAADEAAVRWLRDPSGQVYGSALLRLLRESVPEPAPSGGLAIVESGRNWKRRIELIKYVPRKAPRLILGGTATLALATLIFARSTGLVDNADGQAAAVQAQRWLEEIDRGDYATGWADMAPRVQAKLGPERWRSALDQTRAALGRCDARKATTVSLERDPIWPEGTIPGNYYAVEFRTSFKHLNYGRESVIVSADRDGIWKVYSYYVRP